jgi:archaellum biogenesis ATPase FlaH
MSTNKNAKTQISKEVNAVLDSEARKFASFDRAKDAYNYFVDHYPKIAKHVSYDNFHYYWTKKFPHAKLTTKRASFDAAPQKAALPKTDAPVDVEKLKEEADVELKIFNPKTEKVDEAVFVPFKTGKGVDIIVSQEGGFMPGTINVIFADGGVGKSTIAFDSLYAVQKNYKNAECMAFSSEMSRIDLQAEINQGKKWMEEVKQVLMEDYKPEQYKAVIRKVILYGYDFLVIDSLQSIIEKLVAKCYMNKNQALSFILDLLKAAAEGKTETKKCVAIFLIQQVNKDGNFVGANSLKHDCTGMMIAKFDDNGERYVYYMKNRRCGRMVKKKLYYHLNEQNEVVYESERFQQDREREELARKNQENLQKNKETFSKIFLKGKNNDANIQVDDDLLLDEVDEADEVMGE